MDNKSPYVLIGAAMMLFIAAVVGFVIWKLRAGDRTAAHAAADAARSPAPPNADRQGAA